MTIVTPLIASFHTSSWVITNKMPKRSWRARKRNSRCAFAFMRAFSTGRFVERRASRRDFNHEKSSQFVNQNLILTLLTRRTTDAAPAAAAARITGRIALRLVHGHEQARRRGGAV